MTTSYSVPSGDGESSGARPWAVEVVRHVFEATVALYAWGFGESNARMVVGSLALMLLVLVTALTAFCALREVGAIGMKLAKLLLTLAVALLLGSMVVPAYEFVFPGDAERRAAAEAAAHVADQAREWTVAQWWHKLV